MNRTLPLLALLAATAGCAPAEAPYSVSDFQMGDVIEEGDALRREVGLRVTIGDDAPHDVRATVRQVIVRGEADAELVVVDETADVTATYRLDSERAEATLEVASGPRTFTLNADGGASFEGADHDGPDALGAALADSLEEGDISAENLYATGEIILALAEEDEASRAAAYNAATTFVWITVPRWLYDTVYRTASRWLYGY